MKLLKKTIKKISFLEQTKKILSKINFSKVLFYTSLLLFIFLGITFFYFGDLSYWDAIGHLDSGLFINQNLFPDYTGFNPNYLLGFQQGLFYSPLVHYLISIFLFFFSQELASKLIMAFLIIILPFTIYYFSKKLMNNENESRYLSIIIMASWVLIDNLSDFTIGTPGIGPHSTFQVGLIPAFLVAPLTFIFLGVLIDVLNEKKNWKIASIILTLILLSHFSGFGIALFVLFYIIVEKNKRKELTKILLFALILCSFWLLPFLVYYNFVPQAIFIGNIPQSIIVITIISFILSFVQKNNFLKNLSFFCFTLLMLWMYTTYFYAPFQFFRLQPLIVLFVLIPIYKFVVEKKFEYIKKSIIIIFFIILIIGFFSQIKITTNNYLEFYSTNQYNGRVLFLKQNDYLSEFHSTYINSVSEKNLLSANGLFVESTITSELICALLVHLDSEFQCWGVVNPYKGRYPYGVYEKQLDTLGINWIVSEYQSPSVYGVKSKELFLKRNTIIYDKFFSFVPTHSYKIENNKYIYEVNDTNLIEIPKIVISKNIVDEKEWKKFVSKWFFEIDSNIYIKTSDDKNYFFEKKEDIELNYYFSQDYKIIKLDINSKEKIPILIKFNWDPRWVAYNENGEQIKIYKASPYSMMVIASGQVTIKNQPNLIDIIGRLISVFGIIIMLVVTFFESNLKNK